MPGSKPACSTGAPRPRTYDCYGRSPGSRVGATVQPSRYLTDISGAGGHRSPLTVAGAAPGSLSVVESSPDSLLAFVRLSSPKRPKRGDSARKGWLASTEIGFSDQCPYGRCRTCGGNRRYARMHKEVMISCRRGFPRNGPAIDDCSEPDSVACQRSSLDSCGHGPIALQTVAFRCDPQPVLQEQVENASKPTPPFRQLRATGYLSKERAIVQYKSTAYSGEPVRTTAHFRDPQYS
jgi:hypothetical protein